MSILAHIRKSDTYISTEKTALMVNKSVEWVRKNTKLFEFKRDTEKGKKGKKLLFELSSVLQVWKELNNQNLPS